MDDQAQLRSFKPFYGAVGALLTSIMSGEQAILTINLFFYFGLIAAMFYLLKELSFSNAYATIGASWVATGYPVLKYGLALLTDISGWFFATATMAMFLIALRKNNGKGGYQLLLATSLIGFVGSLCKETGLLGLLFAGSYLCIYFLYTRKWLYIKQLSVVVLPFILLQGTFLYILFQKSTGHASFIDWFLFNKNTIGYGLHTWFYFFFTEASAFSLLLLYVFYTGAFLLFKRHRFNAHTTILYVSLLITTLPILVWPVFLTRVLYIGFLFVIPFALQGMIIFEKSNIRTSKVFYTLALLPIVSSITLFLIADGGSLFKLLDHF
jgi:hypothetical protein